LHEPPFIVDDSRPPVPDDFGDHLDELIAAVLPDAERATLEGQDHGPAPDVLAPVLVEFFGR
jgi:hypothetical protein